MLHRVCSVRAGTLPDYVRMCMHCKMCRSMELTPCLKWFSGAALGLR